MTLLADSREAPTIIKETNELPLRRSSVRVLLAGLPGYCSSTGTALLPLALFMPTAFCQAAREQSVPQQADEASHQFPSHNRASQLASLLRI